LAGNDRASCCSSNILEVYLEGSWLEIPRSLVILMEGSRDILRLSRKWWDRTSVTADSFLIPFTLLSTNNSTNDFYGMGNDSVVK